MRNRLARKIILLIAVPVFLFSSAMVVKYWLESRDGIEHSEAIAQRVVSIAEKTVQTQLPDADATEAPAAEQTQPADLTADEKLQAEPTQPPEMIGREKPQAAPAEAATEEHAIICPIEVDFDALLQENADVVAWIYCPDTPINYPVVQADDNDYYLHRLLDGRTNKAGTLFMDYRNAADFSDWNSVIYGHNMKNGTMFACLSNYKNQAYMDAHARMYLLTPEKNYAIDVIAGFTTPNRSELYDAFTPEDAAKERLLSTWLEQADAISGVYPSVEDRLITLSTCTYEYSGARYVLVGIMREIGGGDSAQ